MLKTKKRTALTWIAAALLALPAGAWGADGDGENKLIMDSMTVTANKIEEDILEVPQSITVINETILDEKGITEIPDLVNQIPNMNMSTGTHGGTVSFRGLFPSMFTSSNPVVLYIDGIPAIDNYSFDASLSNVEQVEVLRGPQGTLYGKDAIGGVINIITKTPENQWHGKVGVEYGSDNYMQGTVNLNGPLKEDVFFLNVNGQYAKDDGWIDNTYEGMDSDSNTSEALRMGAALLYTPTERFTARLNVSEIVTEEMGFNGATMAGGTSLEAFTREDETSYDVETQVDNEVLSESLLLAYDFEALTLTATSTHRDVDFDGDYDGDYSDNALYAGLRMFSYMEKEDFTQEIRLASNAETGVRWVGGLYYETSEHQQGPYGQQFPYLYYGSYYNFEMDAHSATDTTTYAAFGQAIIPVADRFELTLGARYQHIDIDFDYVMYYQMVGATPYPYLTLNGDNDWDVFLPKAALNYRVNDRVSAYASYSQGYMPGGFIFFASTSSVEDNLFDPETSTDYEIGVKVSTDRLQGSVALFYMDIEDIHVYRTDAMGNYITENAGNAHSQGIELDLTYRLTDTVDINTALGLIDAEYEEYNAYSYSYDGQKIQNTPAYTANVGLSYKHPGGFYSRVDMRSVGETYYYDDSQYDFVKADAYSTFDARIGYLTGAWDFYVYGKNLTDEEYITSFISSSLLSMAEFGDPLTVGAGIRYSFYRR